MSDETYTLLLEIRTRLNKAIKDMQNMTSAVQESTGRFDAFKTAVSQAGGMIMRDLVRSMTRAVGEAFELGARIVTLENSFVAMATEAGMTELAIEDLRSATKGAVSDFDLYTSANKFLALQLPVTTDQVGELMQASILLGRSLGQDAEKSINDVAIALGRATPRILDNLGVILGLEEAAQIYADRLGIQMSTMDEAERKYAFQVIAIERIIEAAALLEGTTGSAQLAQDRFAAALENAKTRLGQFLSPLAGFSPIIEGILPGLGIMAAQMLPSAIKGIGGLSGALGILGGPIGLVLAAVVALAIAWDKNFLGIREKTAAAIEFIQKIFGGLFDTFQTMLQWFADLGKAISNFVGKSGEDAKKYKSDWTSANESVEYGDSPGGIRNVIQAFDDMEKSWSRMSRRIKPMDAAALGMGPGMIPGGPAAGPTSNSRSVIIQRGAIQISGQDLSSMGSRFRLTDTLGERLGKRLTLER